MFIFNRDCVLVRGGLEGALSDEAARQKLAGIAAR